MFSRWPHRLRVNHAQDAFSLMLAVVVSSNSWADEPLDWDTLRVANNNRQTFVEADIPQSVVALVGKPMHIRGYMAVGSVSKGKVLRNSGYGRRRPMKASAVALGKRYRSIKSCGRNGQRAVHELYPQCSRRNFWYAEYRHSPCRRSRYLDLQNESRESIKSDETPRPLLCSGLF